MAHRRFGVVGAALVLAMVCLGVVGGEEPKSGPPVGGGTPPFGVQDVTGPAKGSKLCYVWRYGGRPSIIVFARSTDERLTRLVKAVDKFVAEKKDKRMASFTVLLAENNDENQKKLAELAKANEITAPLTIAVDGASGPGAYKLSAEVPITVLVSQKNKVQANFCLAEPAPKDEEAQKKEVADVLAAAEKMIAE